MHRTIPIEKLAVGMEVVALDKSWLETNIMFHRFRIRSEEEIQKLRMNGIRMVTVSVETESRKQEDLSRLGPDDDTSLDELGAVTTGPDLQTLNVVPASSVREWMALQAKTIAVVGHTFDEIRMGNAFDVRLLRQQVIETFEMTIRNPNINSFLVTLSEVDDESYVHSANTMILSLALAIHTGIPREELANWGLAALLHDIGKALIPLDILKKPGRLSSDEWDTVKKHPRLGFSILSKNKDSVVRGLAATVCIEHHERKNGTGYPYGIDIKDLDPVTRSLMVLDIYEALTAGRVYRSPLSPAKTMTYLLQNEVDRLDPMAVVQLVQMIGVYPVGSLVKLSDGKIALVAEYRDSSSKGGPVRLLVLPSPADGTTREPYHITLPAIDRSHVLKTYHPKELGLAPPEILRYLELPGPGFLESDFPLT